MEQSIKPRKYDLNPDEFLAAVAGEMTAAELGVYWMICLLQYSRRGPIKYDMEWLRRKFTPSQGLRVVEPIVRRLIASGRVVRDGDELYVRRVRDEVEMASRRVRDAIENGKRGGRPSNYINGLEKGSGSETEKLTSTTTTTTIKEKILSSENLDSDSVAARGAALGANGSVSAILSQTANAISVNGHKPLSQEQKHERWVQKIWLHLCRTRPVEEVGRIVDGYSNGEPWAKAQFEAIDQEIKTLKAAKE